MSDPVLIRADGSYLYTLPSVVDDIDLGITHVIRGEDHVSNTGTQIEILEALDGRVPAFAHHNLLTGAEGEGLSKRLGSLSLSELRADGYEPMAVALVAVLTGTSLPVEPYADLRALAERLELSMISHGSARFDPAELDSINARLLHEMPYEAARPRLPRSIGHAAWDILRANLGKFSDIEAWAGVFEGRSAAPAQPEEDAFLADALELLPPEPWDETTWAQWTGALKEKSGRKGRALFHPLRLALTGKEDGPELKSLLPLLGRTVCRARLS
jgi:glutamyl-tRNA synthetase